MVDAHTHIDQFGDQLPKALKQIRELSIYTLAVSMDLASFEQSQKIARNEPLIIPSFGIHPWRAPEYVDRLDVLSNPLEQAKAIGEIGLCHRFVEDKTQYPAQRTVFSYFLDAAEESGKLINLHTSGAESEILENLRTRNLPAIIIHWYSGPLHFVKEFLDLGAYFTIGVDIHQSKRTQRLAKDLPENRILTETDNPSGWEWLQGETGFPELIKPVEQMIADIRCVSAKQISETVGRNYRRILYAGSIQI